MSEQNSLKQLYQTAKTTADLDLFLYTALGVVGTAEIVEIVADEMHDDLIKAFTIWGSLVGGESRNSEQLAAISYKMKQEFIKFAATENNSRTRYFNSNILGCEGDNIECFNNAYNSCYGAAFPIQHRTYAAQLCHKILSWSKQGTGLFTAVRFGAEQTFIFAERHPITLNGTWKSRQTFINHIFNFIRSN